MQRERNKEQIKLRAIRQSIIHLPENQLARRHKSKPQIFRSFDAQLFVSDEKRYVKVLNL